MKKVFATVLFVFMSFVPAFAEPETKGKKNSIIEYLSTTWWRAQIDGRSIILKKKVWNGNGMCTIRRVDTRYMVSLSGMRGGDRINLRYSTETPWNSGRFLDDVNAAKSGIKNIAQSTVKTVCDPMPTMAVTMVLP